MDIRIAATEPEIRACFPAMFELRPHLTEAVFTEQVQRQMRNHGYTLVCAVDDGGVVAAAGYRVAEFLAWGRTFYVDDLVTLNSARKHGHGGKLLDWLMDKAMELQCDQFHLDSGVQRHDAHRLYLVRKLKISSHHFSMGLAGHESAKSP